MPVFTVSENTCARVGFSTNRPTRPSSPSITVPNSMGESIGLSTIVASASLSRW